MATYVREQYGLFFGGEEYDFYPTLSDAVAELEGIVYNIHVGEFDRDDYPEPHKIRKRTIAKVITDWEDA